MKIGDLAKQTGCPVETIRYYEREGLLHAAKRDAFNNYRRYDVTHLERLIFIRRCRALEMTQHEIHELLQARAEPNASCVSINELLDGHIEHVRHRIVELEALQQQLVELRQQCHEVHTNQDCGILRELDSAESVLTVGKKLHKIC